MKEWKERLWDLAVVRDYLSQEFVSVMQAGAPDLSMRDRSVLLLRCVGGFSFADIARELHISKKQAFRRFKGLLAGLGLDEARP